MRKIWKFQKYLRDLYVCTIYINNIIDIFIKENSQKFTNMYLLRAKIGCLLNYRDATFLVRVSFPNENLQRFVVYVLIHLSDNVGYLRFSHRCFDPVKPGVHMSIYNTLTVIYRMVILNLGCAFSCRTFLRRTCTLHLSR